MLVFDRGQTFCWVLHCRNASSRGQSDLHVGGLSLDDGCFDIIQVSMDCYLEQILLLGQVILFFLTF